MGGHGEPEPFAAGEPELQAPAEPEQRVESEPLVEERPGTELFGLPMMLFVLALIAVVKGLITGSAGFTIIGAVVAGGIFLAIGFSMTIAKRE